MGNIRSWAIGLLLAVAAICRAQVTFTQYSVPTTDALQGITAGPDGNLWFLEHVGKEIWRMTPAGVITGTFVPPTTNNWATLITAGPDGNLWFTEYMGQRIGRITPAGVITEFRTQTSGFPFGITSGPDGNLWFTERFGNIIGRITPAGVITEFRIPNGSEPLGITAGPDGNLWFAGGSANKIGRITPAGVITDFPLPPGDKFVQGIATGPDGNLWFTEVHGNMVGRITSAGVVTEFSIPTADSAPEGITAGPDGNLWFTEYQTNKLGRITPAGVITEFLITTSAGVPQTITVGPDGNLWFGDVNQVIKATIPVTPPTGGLAIYPAIGGNAGNATVQIFGSGFQSGATVKLTGVGPDIIGSNINVTNSFALTTTFLLSGAAIGARNIIVTNPDKTSATLADGFTVQQGGAPQLWGNVVGRDRIRIGTPQSFYISYGNNGNVDALGTRLIAYVPSSVAPNLTLGNSNGVVTTVTQGSTTLITVNLGRVPAGSTSFIPVTLTAGASQAPFQVQINISGR